MRNGQNLKALHGFKANTFRFCRHKYLPQQNFRQQKFCGPPEGRSDYGLCNDKTQNGTTSLFRRVSAIPFSSASFLPILFWQDRKEWAVGDILRHPAQKNSPFLGLLLRAKLSTCGCGLFTNLLFTTAQQMFHKIACGQISFSRTLACGQITVENTGQNPVFHIKFPY